MVSWVKAHLNTLWPNTFGPKSPSESLKIFDDMDPMTWISLLVVLPPVVTGNTYVTRRRTAFVWFPVAYSVWTRTTSERQLCTYEKEREKWFVCNWTKKGANGSSRGCFGCPHTLLRMGTIDGEGDKAGGHYYRFIGTCLYISLYIRSLLLPFVRFPRLMTSPRVIPAYRYNALCRIGHVFLLWTTTHLMKPQLYYTGLFFPSNYTWWYNLFVLWRA